MTEQNIHIFLAVVRGGSISAAAQELFITQPAVSRHIRDLERELGYPLLRRGKGVRHVELTAQGERFIAVARRWSALWQETQALAGMDPEGQLNLSSVGSVSTYLLPPAFRSFRARSPGYSLSFHNYHSLEAYHYVDSGQVDLALISDDMYFRGVDTVPAFREPMVLLTPADAGYPQRLHPSQLDPRLEIRMPWNPEYDQWHDYWFRASAQPRVLLDQMTLLEDFFSWTNSWAIMPLSAARAISSRQNAVLHTLDEGPAPRIIYYLQRQAPKRAALQFLDCLKEALARYPEIDCLF